MKELNLPIITPLHWPNIGSTWRPIKLHLKVSGMPSLSHVAHLTFLIAIYFREWKLIPRLPQPRRHHGCGSFQDQQNQTMVVILGGLSGNTEFLNDILVLSLDGLNQAWRRFEFTSLPYSNIILKSLVLYLDEKRCEIMFAGIDGLYSCKKNFSWTSKSMKIKEKYKFTWSGIARLQDCWNRTDSVKNY